MSKICFILGTRPEIIKMYSTIKLAQKQGLDFFIIHSNQHYDAKMDQVFFEELEIPAPKYNLNIGSGKHGEMTGKMLVEIEKILLAELPNVALVQGDTNTVLAGALASSKILGIKIGHIEAGLRSYNREMPEEINRILTDHVSDFLFAPTEKQAEILKSEGIEKEKIFVVGNTIVDAVLNCRTLAKKTDILEKIEQEVQTKIDNYVLLTCHRPSNTDSLANFTAILEAAQTICETKNCYCIFPMHPRLRSQLSFVQTFDRIKVIEPVGFLEMLNLEMNSSMILTDSGGIQEESCILEKKCVILRTDTERPETVEVGGAILVTEITKKEIIDKSEILDNKKVNWSNPFGDGLTANKILEICQF